MSANAYLKPFNEAFFERGLATEESIIQHLRFAFETERGSFLANPSYGCDADFLHQALTELAESKLLSFFQESIVHSDPRVTAVVARKRGRTPDSFTVELEVSYRELGDSGVSEKKTGLRTTVDFHDWNVSIEKAG